MRPLPAPRLRVLEAKAGTTPRIRGRAGQAMRRETLEAGRYTCVDCGLVSLSNEVDHDIPLEQGGTDHEANRKVRCHECHAAKTKREAGQRAQAPSA